MSGDSGSIRLRVMRLPPDISSAELALGTHLDDSERGRAGRFRDPRDARSYAAAHGLVRVVLSELCSQPPGALRFDRDSRGKPRLVPDTANITFSLSHSRGVVAIAAGYDVPLGVDVEAVPRANLKVLEIASAFRVDEKTLVAAALPACREEVFLRLWTLKEALAKASGKGLGPVLDGVSFAGGPTSPAFHSPAFGSPEAWRFWSFEGRGFIAALAARDEAPRTVDFQEIPAAS